VAEADEEAPGGFLADRTTHTNAPRTMLTLSACGPSGAAGNLVLSWDSSVVNMYTTPTGGTALEQFIKPFSGFNGTNLYVEGIAPGSNTLSWAYSGQSDCVDVIKATVLKVDMTAHRPTTELFAYGSPFQRTAVPDDKEESPGAGIRVNGDSESGANENDLIEVQLNVAPFPIPSGLTYVLKRNNSNIKVWDNQAMGTALLVSDTEAMITITSSPMSVWVENSSGGSADLELIACSETTNVCSDKIHFYPFSSVVIVLGGENQGPTDPAAATHGTFQLAIDLYDLGYDVHMYDEDVVVDETDGGIAFAEVQNAVQNRNVTQIAILGYSHGGGSAHDLAENLNNNGRTTAFTAYIDAVAQPDVNPAQENRRPPGTAFLVNYYQENGAFELGGGPVPDANFELDVTTTGWGAALDHYNVDDHQNVRNGVRDQLFGHVNP
ncbi:MAG: hypothetical protein LBN38_08250, partial [Verrucomicrobiota bacterium]|jgi:hypothetical protein|nr:hypothetical protein [Verrucomicrobiota bacterium]